MAKVSQWMVEEKTSKTGKPYKAYVLDKDGNKIPSDTAPDALAQLIAGKEVRKAKVQGEPKSSEIQ